MHPLESAAFSRRTPLADFDVPPLPFKMTRIALPSGRAVTLRGHQTGELGGLNLANIAEMFGYSDDPFPMLY